MEASKVLEQHLARKGSLKALAFGSGVHQKKTAYALACETLKCQYIVTSHSRSITNNLVDLEVLQEIVQMCPDLAQDLKKVSHYPISDIFC